MFIDIVLSDDNMLSFSSFIDIDYKINSSPEDEIILGNASAASLNFSIWNADKKWNEFKFKNSIAYLYRDEERTKRLGVFAVDKITKNKNSLRFECMDFMAYKMDVPFKGIGKTNFTIWELLKQIETQLEIKIANKEEDFPNIVVPDTTDILNKKCREIIQFIGQVSCKYAIFNPEGELFFTWYNLENSKKDIPYSKLKDFARDEDELTITRVKVTVNDEEYVQGLEEGYDLRLSTDNPFLKHLNADSINSVLKDIYDKVYGMHYLSCDISIGTDDDIEIGDTLRVQDEDGNYYKILVTYLNINKLFLTKITSAGESVNRDSQSSSSSSSSNSGDRTYISKDENWKNIAVNNFYGETFLNSISIFGVNEKSSAFLSFNIELDSTVEADVKFLLYTNDILTKEIFYKIREGKNIFSWAEAANIKVNEQTNVFKFVLDTSELSQDLYFYISQYKSVLSVISSGARAGSNIITNLEFKEEFNKLTLVNNINRLILNDFEDTIEIIVQEYIDTQATDVFTPLSFKPRTRMEIENINELVE